MQRGTQARQTFAADGSGLMKYSIHGNVENDWRDPARRTQE